jgi:enoyl-CoA hydratase/carnithine racemase
MSVSLPTAPKPAFAGETLSWTVSDSIVEVELHHGPANEIGSSMLAELECLAAFIRAGAEGAKALIFFSSMRAGFSAGADLRELYRGLLEHRASRGSEEDRAVDRVRNFLDRIHGVYNTIDLAPLTTVAAVHGVVFGGGFELALTCDVIVAEKTARFCFPELRLGLIPGWGGIPRLRRDLGNGLVRDLLLTGRSLNAKRAHDVGLVSQLVSRGEGLTVARRVAQQVCRFERTPSQVAKAFMKPFPADELEREKELFCELFTSPDVEAALKRFVESDDLRPYLP